MKCTNCGTELRDGATFCHACGHSMGGIKNTDSPYVLVTGSEIDLNEKTPIYQKVKELNYRAAHMVLSSIPIIGVVTLPLLYEIKNECIDAENRLFSFENQENILNAILTDMIYSKLNKIRKVIDVKIMFHVLTIVLIVLGIIINIYIKLK